MNYEIYFNGMFFGIASDMPEDESEALNVIRSEFDEFIYFGENIDTIHIEREAE